MIISYICWSGGSSCACEISSERIKYTIHSFDTYLLHTFIPGTVLKGSGMFTKLNMIKETLNLVRKINTHANTYNVFENFLSRVEQSTLEILKKESSICLEGEKSSEKRRKWKE